MDKAATPRKTASRHPRLVKTLAIAGLAACLVFGMLFVAILYARKHAEPIVRERIVHTLEERLHANVELDQVRVSIVTGNVQVGGAGLRIVSAAGHPLLAAKSFEFSTGLRDLFSKRSALVKVRVQGLNIHIPAGPEREAAAAPWRSSFRNPRQGIFSVVEVIATDSVMSIDRLDPSRPPLVFQIGKLRFSQSVPGMPFIYDATLINPKPVGEIHSTGRFGPWNSEVPRDSPIAGSFTFSNADLSTISGIHGHLDGQGSIAGTLGEITSDGSTRTPDFGIDPGTTGTELDTTFHAIVDGTTGDVELQPVQAQLLHTSITAQGRVRQGSRASRSRHRPRHEHPRPRRRPPAADLQGQDSAGQRRAGESRPPAHTTGQGARDHAHPDRGAGDALRHDVGRPGDAAEGRLDEHARAG